MNPNSEKTSKGPLNLRKATHGELVSFLESMGEPAFRASQIEDWVMKKNIRSFDEMTNLPKSLRETLAAHCLLGGVEPIAIQQSADGSRKYLLKFDDGVAVECVGMPSRHRLTACVSTQAGCRMGCVFCATGKGGFTRNLTADEIYDQAAFIAQDFGERVSSVVLMGQGEPFANYDEVIKAMDMLNSPEGMGIGARHITVSTCGLIPMIRRFADEPHQYTLAVSLHSAIQSTRNLLMPGVHKYSLQRLHDALADYTDKTNRRPTYEYAMIDGVNDTNDELEALVAFCEGTLCHVNLIQLNDSPNSKLKPSSPAKVETFLRRLGQAGVEATLRESRGQDIDAACGQLSQKLR